MNKLELTNLEKQLDIVGQECVQYLRQLLQSENKIATGELIRSLDYQVVEDLHGLLLQISAADQFKYVDGGRRAGSKQPPTGPIKRWLQAKGLPFKKLEQTAFVVARSIGKKGIRPLHLKDKMITNIISKQAELLKSGASKDIQELIDKIFYKKS